MQPSQQGELSHPGVTHLTEAQVQRDQHGESVGDELIKDCLMPVVPVWTSKIYCLCAQYEGDDICIGKSVSQQPPSSLNLF